jgi:phage anti-repressor protein
MEYINTESIEERELENFLNITWEPQKTFNSLAIEYVFNKNALFNIIIYIYDENHEQLYFSELKRSVSIHFKRQLFASNNYR